MVDKSALIAAAMEARTRAYAPFSKFLVGAALLTKSGRVFAGCNVENCSFGLTICAERTAATSAVAAGEREFVHLALALSGAGTPCGACRQFLAEFNPDLPITIVNADDPKQVIDTDLATLLPGRFELK
jgi:cytidine deaminase